MLSAKYARVFNIGLQNTFVYRWNFILRAIFGVVPLTATVFVWKAIYQSRGQPVAGYEYSSMVFYFLCAMLVENLITPTEDEWQIAADIRDGQMNAFLTKPLNYLGYRLSIFASGRVVYSLVTLPVIALVFYFLREHISLPPDVSRWLLTSVSVVMAALLQFFIAYCLGILAFWFLEVSTLVFIFYSFEYLLSGQLFPIDIMPGWLQGVMNWLPFKYELFFPVAIFLGRVNGVELWTGLLIQAAWVVLLWQTALAIWRAGIRKYQAVGG